MPVIGCAVTPSMSSLTPGIRRKPSSSGFGTMGGISSAASKRIAGSMVRRSVTIGGTLIGLTGWLSGGLKVLVVRYGKKYYATNRLTLSAAEVRRLYRIRAQIEEVIRACKDQLALTGCQARSERAQQHHIACCLVAFCVLERERHDRQLSIYQLKRQLSFKGRSLALPALERLRTAT